MFARYAAARMDEADRTEIYRAYVARHLQLLAGTKVTYVELAHGAAQADFDAEQVVDDVASRIAEEG